MGAVGTVRGIIKLIVLVAIVAAAAGVVALVVRGRSVDSVSYDEWPEVPHNPAA